MKKTFLKELKRAAAVMLSAAMAIGGLQGFGAGVSSVQAANELEDNKNLMNGKFKASGGEHKYPWVAGNYTTNSTYPAGTIENKQLLTYGNSDSTGYVYGDSSRNYSNTSIGSRQFTFDFAAIPEAINTEPTTELQEGYRLGKNAGLMTSYQFGWWNTFYAFGTEAQVRPQNIEIHTNGNIKGANNPTVLPKPLSSVGAGWDTNQYKANAKMNGQVVQVNNGSNVVEVRPEIKVSQDGRWLIVEYTVHNASDQHQDFWIGNQCDTMIYNHDGCPTIVTPHQQADITNNPNKPAGLHLIANTGGTYKFTSLDILTYHPDPSVDAGIKKRAGTDNSKLSLWSGYWSTTPKGPENPGVDYSTAPYNVKKVSHNYWAFYDTAQKFANDGVDAAGAFSAYFDLNPYETKTARFAVSMKVSVYYVYPDAPTDGNGYIATPAKSIQKAVAEIKSSGTKKAYIYLMGDVELDQKVEIPKGVDITIGTTDFEYNSNISATNPPVFLDVDAPRKKITRKSGFNDTMFEVGNEGTTQENKNTGLTISNVIIDGGNSNTSTGPIISAKKGWVKTQKGAVLQNNKINPATPDNNIDVASAIDISEGANLNMSYGEIKDNTSRNGSAVVFNGASFTINNQIKIIGNKDSFNKPANVKLGANKVITVGEDIGGDSSIGISVVDPPATATDERVVVQRANPTLTAMPYSAGNFTPDKDGNTTQLGTNANDKNVVLKTSLYAYTVRHVNANNNLALKQDVTDTKPAGKEISELPDNTLITSGGYKVTGVELSTGSNLSVDNATKKVTGSMPATDVIITFKYSKSAAVYKFDPQGGYPVADMTELVTGGGSALSMPVAARAGYDFVNWTRYEENDGINGFTSGDTATAEHTFPNPVEDKTYYYYASWTPGITNYNIEEKHRSINPRLQKSFGTRTDSKPVDTVFEAMSIANNIPGYMFANANDAPVQTVFPGHTQWDPADNYKYKVKVGAQDFNVNYNYKVDPSQKFHFKIQHKKAGAALPGRETDVLRAAEQAISASPLSAAQLAQSPFDLSDYSVTANIILGKTGNLDVGNGIISYPISSTDIRRSGTDDYKMSPTEPDFDPVTNVFSSFMPNQDVTIEYVYGPSGTFNVNLIARDQIDQSILERRSEAQAAGAALNYTAPAHYGYIYGSGTDDPAIGSFDGAGTYTASMPTRNLTLTYDMARDPAYWRQMTFVTASSSAGYGTVAGQPVIVDFLRDDMTTAGRKPDTFAKIKERGSIINKIAPNDAPYYRFAGWFKDDACTIPVNDADTFDNSATVYAKFEEDPAYWIDIHFVAGAHGTLNRPAALHTKRDNKWSDIGINDNTDVTPEVNYMLGGWYLGGIKIAPSTTLINGALYTAMFVKKPEVWGLRIGDFNASGHIGPDGSGQIRVRETQAGNVYIVSDDFGNVVAVKTAPNNDVLLFDDLYPGTKYHVQEAAPGTVVSVGQPMPAPVPGVISEPKPVIIPTLEDNYNVGFDPKNEDRAQIVVNPADPDSDYALIDEDGNVVQYPGSDNGWKTPIGRRPSTVTFDNLDPGKTYTVVARKKGDTRVPDPLSKKEYGTDVIANPGDMVDAKKFIVEVRPENTGGVKIVTVAGTAPSQHETGSSDWKVTDAKEKDEVVIHADPVNSAGKRFLYWVVAAGRSRGVSGKIQANDFTFSMSANNIVLRAVYERPGPAEGNDNAIVEEEIRGGALGEYGIEPDYISELEEKLTTPADRVLINTNGADVRYKIIFNKRKVRTPERDAVKEASIAGQDHPTAFNAAWALDIEAERYVDGRLVGRATDSNAEVPVLIQLPNEDTDMMDYELFDVTDPATRPVPKMMDFTDPENTAGYCRFKGRVKGKYVLVYSKAFKLRFFDTIQALDFEDLNNPLRNFYHRLKVRRGEHPDDVWYNTTVDYQIITDYQNGNSTPPIKTPLYDIYGVEYIFKNAWSKKANVADMSAADFEKPQNKFLMTDAVTRGRSIFAYYTNDRPRKEKAWNDLDSLKTHAQDLARSPYLKQEEIAELEGAITRAIARLNQKRGELLNLALFGASGEVDAGRMANYYELQAELDNLGRLVRKYEELIDKRNNNFIGRTGGSSGGGSGSAGKGIGSAARPFEHVGERTFMLGVDGNWKINESTGRWSFVLNGGLPLNNTWGKIQYSDEKTNKLLTKWYFFDPQSSMVQGWYHDVGADKWYFLNPDQGADAGQMIMGWYKDAAGFWYYLDPVVGEMYTGWCRIGEHWYYFSPISVEGHPKGSLYVSTATPDGYKVNYNGEWVQ